MKIKCKRCGGEYDLTPSIRECPHCGALRRGPEMVLDL